MNAILVAKNNLSMNVLKHKGIVGTIVTMSGRMKRVVGAGKNLERNKRMADFCKQCSIEMFNKDFRELARSNDQRKLTEQEKTEGYGWVVLCETCGPILVNDDGVCTDMECSEHGESNRGGA